MNSNTPDPIYSYAPVVQVASLAGQHVVTIELTATAHTDVELVRMVADMVEAQMARCLMLAGERGDADALLARRDSIDPIATVLASGRGEASAERLSL